MNKNLNKTSEALLKVELKHNENSAYVFLPDETSAIDNALRKLGVQSAGECDIRISSLTPLVNVFYFNDIKDDVYQMNITAETLKNMLDSPENKINAVLVQPGEPAIKVQLDKSLKGLQAAVGGYIENIYYLDDALMIGNEESKLIGMAGNRRFGDRIIAGPFIICDTEIGDDGGELCSLSDELCEKYLKQFEVPDEISQLEVQSDSGYIIFSF